MPSNPKRAILFANGGLPAPERIRTELTADDLLIAVDGGLRHIIALGLTPHLIIGDLDSANPQDVQRFEAQGVEVRRFPQEKNETDLELGFLAALETHPAALRVVGALGGRLDQTLGNIFLLTRPQWAELDIRLTDGEQELFLIRGQTSLHGQPGQRVSLLPLFGPVTGVRTEGLAFPLNAETLYPDHTRGISNRMLSTTANVTIETGTLLCIHEIQQPVERMG